MTSTEEEGKKWIETHELSEVCRTMFGSQWHLLGRVLDLEQERDDAKDRWVALKKQVEKLEDEAEYGPSIAYNRVLELIDGLEREQSEND